MLPVRAWMREIRSEMTCRDWPASMSKSMPTRCGVAHRPMKVSMPESLPQVNDPASPPVETM